MATQQSPQQESFHQDESEPIDISHAFIFEYEELQEATKFFNPAEVVGEGGYGVVYRGKLADGRAVAVKELSVRHERRIEQFINEVRVLSGLRHKNLVTLYGCTNPKDDKLLLVYEFVPNGTVAYHLHGKIAYKEILNWGKRIHIAVETAEALVYLHSLEPPIIHRDVKSDNVLLDHNFNVKVVDFGLCRLLPTDGAHISTMPQGTQGYMDPEYNQHYKLTTKSDVFSFGVFLVELISGKAVLDPDRGTDDEIWLGRMFFNKMKNKKLEQLVDLELGYGDNAKISKMVKSVAKLAYKCLQPKGYTRPPMMEVLRALMNIRDGAEMAKTARLIQSEQPPYRPPRPPRKLKELRWYTDGLPPYKRNRTSENARHQVTIHTPSPHHDGYEWIKNGQRMRVGSSFPRSYYQCSRCCDQGCPATKQVQQQNSDEPPMFQVNYFRAHTCTGLVGSGSDDSDPRQNEDTNSFWGQIVSGSDPTQPQPDTNFFGGQIVPGSYPKQTKPVPDWDLNMGFVFDPELDFVDTSQLS